MMEKEEQSFIFALKLMLMDYFTLRKLQRMRPLVLFSLMSLRD